MTKCTSCGRNTRSENNENSPINGDKYCAECSDIQGNLLPFSEVLENFANYFMNTLGYDIAVSRNAAMEILKRQPAWEPMFKKEEKMRTKKRMFAIVAGALAVVLFIVVVSYGLSKQLYFEAEPSLIFSNCRINESMLNNKSTFELHTKYLMKPIILLEKYGLLYSRGMVNEKERDCLIGLENKEIYLLRSPNKVKSLISSGVSDDGYYYWQEEFYGIFTLKMIPLNSIITINKKYSLKKCTNSELHYNVLQESFANETLTIHSKNSAFFSLQTSKDFFVWMDTRNENVTSYDIYGYNILTKKEFPIATDAGDQKNILISDNRIFWEDYQNPNIKLFELWMFDLTSGRKQKIPLENVNSWNANGDKIIFSKYRNGLYLYDIKTNQSSCITNNELCIARTSRFYYYFPSQKNILNDIFFITKTDKENDFYIVWEESVKEFENKPNSEPTYESRIGYKKCSKIKDETNYVDWDIQKSQMQRIESVSNSGILWALTNHIAEEALVERNSFEEGDQAVLKYFDFKSLSSEEIEKNYIDDSSYSYSISDTNSVIGEKYMAWAEYKNTNETKLRYRNVR